MFECLLKRRKTKSIKDEYVSLEPVKKAEEVPKVPTKPKEEKIGYLCNKCGTRFYRNPNRYSVIECHWCGNAIEK